MAIIRHEYEDDRLQDGLSGWHLGELHFCSLLFLLFNGGFLEVKKEENS